MSVTSAEREINGQGHGPGRRGLHNNRWHQAQDARARGKQKAKIQGGGLSEDEIHTCVHYSSDMCTCHKVTEVQRTYTAFTLALLNPQ